MALFGGARDISLFRHVNRELMADVITQQCSFYKFKLEETRINLYGEAAGGKHYMGPVLLNCLILLILFFFFFKTQHQIWMQY